MTASNCGFPCRQVSPLRNVWLQRAFHLYINTVVIVIVTFCKTHHDRLVTKRSAGCVPNISKMDLFSCGYTKLNWRNCQEPFVLPHVTHGSTKIFVILGILITLIFHEVTSYLICFSFSIGKKVLTLFVLMEAWLLLKGMKPSVSFHHQLKVPLLCSCYLWRLVVSVWTSQQQIRSFLWNL